MQDIETLTCYERGIASFVTATAGRRKTYELPTGLLRDLMEAVFFTKNTPDDKMKPAFYSIFERTSDYDEFLTPPTQLHCTNQGLSSSSCLQTKARRKSAAGKRRVSRLNESPRLFLPGALLMAV
jgi:hypothetical protein